jgi:GTPase SAR1 family protein
MRRRTRSSSRLQESEQAQQDFQIEDFDVRQSQRPQSYASVDIFESQPILIDDNDDDVRSFLPDYEVIVKREPVEDEGHHGGVSRADSRISDFGFLNLSFDNDDMDLRTQAKSSDSRPEKASRSFEEALDYVGEIVVETHHRAATGDDDVILIEEDDAPLIPKTQKDSLPVEETEDETLEGQIRRTLKDLDNHKLTLKSPEQMISEYEALDAQCRARAELALDTEDRLAAVFKTLPAQGAPLRDIWTSQWSQSLSEARRNLQRPMDEVIIGVYGESGAGKSSVLNSVIGEYVLPTNSSAGCTAAATELVYRPHGYQVSVQFMDKQTFNILRMALIRQYKLEKSQKARDFIRAVWGDVDLASSGKAELQTPTDFEPLLGTTKTFAFASIQQARACVAKYVDSTDTGVAVQFAAALAPVAPSKHTTRSTSASASGTPKVAAKRKHEPKLWPIVKILKIEGPWKILSGGVKLVDLPGSGDYNKARQDAADDFMTKCKHLWICSNIKRAATNAQVADLLGMSKRAKQEALMRGLLASACVVATQADDVNEAEVRRNLGLADMQLAKSEIARLRNNYSKSLIKENLLNQVSAHVEDSARARDDDDDGSDDFQSQPSQLAGNRNTSNVAATSEEAEAIQQSLAQTPVFTVSALEYSRMHKLEGGSSAPQVFEDELDTEIPLLQSFIVDLGFSARKTCLEGKTRQIVKILEEIKSQCQSLDQTSQVGARERLDSILQNVWPFFAENVKSTIVRPMLEELRQIRAPHIDDRLDEALKQLVPSMEAKVATWRQRNFMSIKSALKHGGASVSKTNEFNLNEELVSEGLRDRIASGWHLYFNMKVADSLQTNAIQIKSASDHFHNTVRLALHTSHVYLYDERLQTFVKQVDRTLLQRNIDGAQFLVEQVTERHRELVVSMREAITARMEPAYTKASGISGSGSFDKMIDLLKKHVRTDGPRIASDIKGYIVSRMDAINEHIAASVYASLDSTLQALKQHYDALHKIQPKDEMKRPRITMFNLVQEELAKYPGSLEASQRNL